MKHTTAIAYAALLVSTVWALPTQAQSSTWWKKYSGQSQQTATGSTPQQGTQTSPQPAASAPAMVAPTPHTPSAPPPDAGPGYSYVEAGYNRVEVDPGSVDEQAGGGYVRGSVAIADQVHLFGSFGRVSKDWSNSVARLDLDIDQLELGIGFHQRFAERADFVTELALLRLGGAVDYRDIDPAESFSGNDHLYAGKLTLGVRAKPSPRTELWLKGGYVKLEDNWLLDDSFVGVVGGKIDFSRRWGVLGEAELYEDVSYYRVGVRVGF